VAITDESIGLSKLLERASARAAPQKPMPMDSHHEGT